MKRFTCSVSALITVITLLASSAAAQTPKAQTPAPEERPFFIEVTAAATLGHKSASSYGAEAGYRLTNELQVVIEGGHMGNITGTDVENRANKIAAAIGATANVVQRGNYGDVGVRYRLMDSGMWHSYLVAGVGAVAMDTETTFSANNSGVNVALGADLFGHVTKTFFMIGGGATVPLLKRYFGDVSYRFGRVFPNSGAIEGDKGTNTQRVQFGFGVRF